VRGITGRLASPAAVAALLLGFVLAGAAYLLAFRHETARAITEFDRHLTQRALYLEHDVTTNIEVLHALASLYAGGGVLTATEFRRFAEAEVRRHIEIDAFEWIPRVERHEREAHEREARSGGATGYRIKELDGSGETVPAGPREEYFPVRLVVPLEGNEMALGFDLGSEPRRREALSRARDSGQAVLSDPVTLVQDAPGSSALLAFVPVVNGPASSTGERRAKLRGFFLGIFHTERLLARWNSNALDQGRGHMEYALLDADVAGEPVVMHASAGWAPSSGSEEDLRERTLSVGGQSWRIQARPTQAFLAQRRSYQPAAIGAAVIVAWNLMAGFLLVLWHWAHGQAERKQSEIFRWVLRSVSDGVVVADKKGRFVFVNDAARRLLGSASWDVPLTERPAAFGLYLPDSRTLCPAERLPLARAVAGESVRDAELFVRNAQVVAGAWVEVSAGPLVDEYGTPQGGVAAFRDVTDRRQTQEAIRRLSSAVEQTADAVVITDLRGRIEYVNPSFEESTGYSRDEVLGRTPAILKSGRHEPEFYRSFWATILSGEVFRGTIINRKKDGELYHAEQTVTPIRTDTGELTHFVSVARDMTERRKAQEQETELRLASQVHRRLFPQAWPRVHGLDIAGEALPATTVCGDYLDHVDMSGGALGIVIGDASGHGMGPALVMAQIRAYLRSLAGTGQDPGQILRWLNETLVSDLEDNHYATLLLATFEPSGYCLSYASAGHTPGFLLDAAGDVKAVLESTGLPLGMFADRDYETRRDLSLDPGDLLVLTTDGVTEARGPDGSQFGQEAVIEAVRRRRRAKSVRDILVGLRGRLREFVDDQPQDDDMTIVLARRDRRVSSPV